MAVTKKNVTPAAIARHQLQTITLPENMSLDTAIESLRVRKEEDDKELLRREEYRGWHPVDVVVQINRAIRDTFGWVSAAASMNMFGPKPPETRRIECAPGEWEDFVIGEAALPAWEGKAFIGNIFNVITKQKYGPQVDALFTLVRHYLETASIFKGRAIDSNWSYLKDIVADTARIMFPAETQAAIDASIWTPLRQWEACAALGLNPKRGVLLTGPYGTGKTLTAMATAGVAVQNGWTFIYVRPEHVASFATLVEMALPYAPVAVFMEDVDFAAGGERTVDMNSILNTLDGITSKNKRLMVVLTTNNLDKIHPALLRPGRLDAIVELSFPDLATRAALLRLYTARPAETLDFQVAAEACVDGLGDGYVGATLREVAERATLYALSRGSEQVATVDLVNAASAVRGQVDRTRNGVRKETPTLDAAMRQMLGETADSLAQQIKA